MEPCAYSAISMKKERQGVKQGMFRPIVVFKSGDMFFEFLETMMVVIHVAGEKDLLMSRIVMDKFLDLLDIVRIHGLPVDVDQYVWSVDFRVIRHSSLVTEYNLLCEILVEQCIFRVVSLGYLIGIPIPDNDPLCLGQKVSI